jgi:glycosyltransferase involved in cell wall biosynthesis
LYALYQLRVMNRIPNWTMVAERDAQNMQRLSPRCKIQVIPNGVDVDGFSSATAAHAPCTAVFVGTLGAAAPNEIAVEWFLRQVWPIVVKAIPEARFTIVGRGASPALEALGCQSKNVTVTGFVPDTRPYFWEAGVFVLPMQSGSGIKNKLLESWAAGCAVVSNKLGVEGVQGAQHEDNVLIWDRPLEMANGLIGLMRDPIRQRELGTRGQDTVRRYYSWKVVAEKIEEYMNEIADGDSVVGVKRN